MSKKGFTIVELIISVAILSIVLVFALNLLVVLKENLVVLKEKETSLDTDTDMVLNQAFVSKKINGDIVKNGGIKSLNCTTTKCDFTFNNEEKKTLTLTNNKKTIKYENEENVELTRTLPKSTYGNIEVEEFLNYTGGTLRIITINNNNRCSGIFRLQNRIVRLLN